MYHHAAVFNRAIGRAGGFGVDQINAGLSGQSAGKRIEVRPREYVDLGVGHPVQRGADDGPFASGVFCFGAGDKVQKIQLQSIALGVEIGVLGGDFTVKQG